ncbi:histidine kinase, partial [bacterium]|nr:histidine kinase [bacterium]
FNETPHVLAAIRDVTERRRLESQMQHAQKLKSLGVLAGGIAHDFNNLLMTILGNADLAMSDLLPSSPARQNIGEVLKASRRAADLCKQMLAYSGKGKFIVRPLDLSVTAKEMSELLRISLSKKATLSFNFSPELPFVMADATQIRQIIMNLVTNASEAIGDQIGAIRLSTDFLECDRSFLDEAYLAADIPEGLYVTLEVSDTGKGMDKETLDKIFDPFFTTKFTGRGLGLAAVLGIVRGHKGTLSVHSGKGRGTTFKILLPAYEGPV